MRAHERCHVRDCVVKATTADTPIFRVAGDMRHLSIILSSVSKRFRNRKNNYVCKVHFLPEDLHLTRTGFSLNKRAVPCLHVPKRTLRLVARNGISPKHSEVASALLERAGGGDGQDNPDSSSDSESDSETATSATGGPPSPRPASPCTFPAVDSTAAASGEDVAPNFVQQGKILTLQQRLQLAGRISTKRYPDNYISRDEPGFADYKRLKVSDSESPPSNGDAASDVSNGNSRAGDDDDDDEDENQGAEQPKIRVPQRRQYKQRSQRRRAVISHVILDDDEEEDDDDEDRDHEDPDEDDDIDEALPREEEDDEDEDDDEIRHPTVIDIDDNDDDEDDDDGDDENDAVPVKGIHNSSESPVIVSDDSQPPPAEEIAQRPFSLQVKLPFPPLGVIDVDASDDEDDAVEVYEHLIERNSPGSVQRTRRQRGRRAEDNEDEEDIIEWDDEMAGIAPPKKIRQ